MTNTTYAKVVRSPVVPGTNREWFELLLGACISAVRVQRHAVRDALVKAVSKVPRSGANDGVRCCCVQCLVRGLGAVYIRHGRPQ